MSTLHLNSGRSTFVLNNDKVIFHGTKYSACITYNFPSRDKDGESVLINISL